MKRSSLIPNQTPRKRSRPEQSESDGSSTQLEPDSDDSDQLEPDSDDSVIIDTRKAAEEEEYLKVGTQMLDWSRLHHGDQGERKSHGDDEYGRRIQYWRNGLKGKRTHIYEKGLDSIYIPTVYILHDRKVEGIPSGKFTYTYNYRYSDEYRTVSFKSLEEGANYFGFNVEKVEIESWPHLEETISNIGMENVLGPPRGAPKEEMYRK